MRQDEKNKNHRINPKHQLTVRREVRVDGIGLHSGKPAVVVIKPALPNTGILFVRKDLEQPLAIPALFEFVTQTKLATTLGRKQVEISTVEHLLSAFKLLGIDNAVCEVEGPEVPIMDGSAAPFCEALRSVGLYDQGISKRVAILKKRIEVRKGDKMAAIEPSHRLHIQARIEWNHPAIGVQEYTFSLDKNDCGEIAFARTFGFLKDVDALKNAGLALGGSLENAVVLDEERVINPSGLRYVNELVRHKVLDAIGDFALSPIQILGDVTLVKAGHELHSELVSAIFSNPDHYEVRNLTEIQEEAHQPWAAATGWFAATLQGSY